MKIDSETLIMATTIILDKILTPVLYLYSDEALEFICFADSKTADADFREAEAELYSVLGINAEILDIRTFDEYDRVEITKSANLLYVENDLVKMLFESAMAADKKRIMNIKNDTVVRKAETGTYYIS
ncbi:MAG: hypothetical protein UHM23_07315 [Clostridia bacterium]|jgi:hypothetical protein|nr:hypothetical protein [Clostridia bacterium]